MSWIDTMTLPLKEGHYTCLVATDDFGTLEEFNNEYFDGKDWSNFESSRQFIRYWRATKEEYKIIHEHLDKEMEEYYKNLQEHSTNFGGI